MAATLPIKTTADDIDKLLEFLGSKPGWVEVSTIKSNIGAAGDTRKLNTLDYIGIIERDGSNVKLTEAGRTMGRATGSKRVSLFAAQLSATPLYHETLGWVHWQELQSPTKIDIASHWIDQSSDEVEGAPQGLITDGVICFFRLAEYGGLGKFKSAGGSREARFDVDRDQLAKFMAQEADQLEETEPASSEASGLRTGASVQQGARSDHGGAVTFDPGVRVNVEIHIAADATPETIEEIFKNMRQYVLNDPESEVESG